MDLATMRIVVRRDLHDEDAGNYRWTDDEIDRHIAHAISEYSNAAPLEESAVLPTTGNSREIDITSIAGLVSVDAAEYPTGRFPPAYRRFEIRGNILTLLMRQNPDGSNIKIYYGKMHTLTTAASTIPARHENIIATGACGYAAIAMAINAVNRVNTGGTGTINDLQLWGSQKLEEFHTALKKAEKRNRLRAAILYSGVED
ncbi:MAG TPA: hypothetical protein VEI27_02055 [Dehalococcoidales bacterium]|nr:hypothetical protein [Dehalococcoidales bacterium]